MDSTLNLGLGGLARRIGLISVAAVALSACDGGFPELVEGTKRYRGPESVIARGGDTRTDRNTLEDGYAAIAYDPDGCQAWIIDDGLEGYSTPRVDPRTGKRICDNKYPPGTVLGTYESPSAPGPDRIPR